MASAPAEQALRAAEALHMYLRDRVSRYALVDVSNEEAPPGSGQKATAAAEGSWGTTQGGHCENISLCLPHTNWLYHPGSVAHWPRHNLRPASSTTQIAVSFCETSKPVNRAIEPPLMMRTAGPQRPGRGIMEDLCSSRDYPMSTHATRPLAVQKVVRQNR